MVPGSAPDNSSREADLTTSSAEQRTRTFDVLPSARSGIAGPAPGDVLRNRFVLHQCLASGSTSRLFRALDRRRESAGEPDPWVVLKVVTAPPGQASGGREPRALQALRREAAIAQGLEHPNLPRILGIDHDGPHTFVCMAWIEGESLAAILDSRGTRPMTRVQALHIVEDISRALTHLHAQGITHADVKPGNILVTAQGNATLLDFGVALGPGAGDLPALRGFTPEYASPEVLAGGEPTPADDLFSLACVAYRMLGGHRAFGAANAREAATTGSRPPRPEQLSPAQWRALDRALSFVRADRQPDVASFLAQLKGARDESAAVTDLPAMEPGIPVAPATTSGSPSRGRRALPRTTVALAVIVVVGIAGAAWLQRAPEPAPVPSASPAPWAASVPVDRDEPTPAPRPSPGPSAGPATRPPADPSVSPAVPAARTATMPPAIPAVAPEQPAPVTRAPARLAAVAPGDVRAAERREAERGAAADTRQTPVELTGPPVPDLTAPAVAPASPGTAALSLDGALADTTAAAQTVPFSRLTIRRYVEPDYPRNAAARRTPGWVDVAFTVEPSGKTRDVRVIGAEPPGLFDEAALAAVRRWRFEGADPVSSKIRLRFEPRQRPNRG